MGKVKLTIAEASKRINQIASLDLEINDKLSYAGKKNISAMSAAMKAHSENHQDKVDAINISNAFTDDKGVLVTDKEGNYSYTPEAAIKRLSELKLAARAYEAKEIEFEPYFAQECPRMAELDEFIVEELLGILFAPKVTIVSNDAEVALQAAAIAEQVLAESGVTDPKINIQLSE